VENRTVPSLGDTVLTGASRVLMDAKHQIAPPNNKPPEHKQRRRRRTSSSTTQQSPRRVTTQSNGYHSSLIGWSTKSTQFRLYSPNEPEHHKASDSNHSTCRRRIQEAELKRWTTRNGRRWTDKKKEVYWKYTTQPTMTTAQPTSSDSSTPGTTTPALPMPSRNPLPLSASQEAQVRDLYYARVRNKCRAEIKGSFVPPYQPTTPLLPNPDGHVR
jgi:hypothetical protein